MAKGNGQGGRCISRGRCNVAQATVNPNSQQSLPSSKLSAIRGRGSRGKGLPSSQPSLGGQMKGTRRTRFGQHFS
ncbi:hypothetical protein ACE6H2_026640 [Prunus campanulata]